MSDVGGAEVALHFGDPAAEYRAVRESAGVVVRADLAHLVLRGRDPVRMLQGLITNDLAAAPATRVVYGAMLTPKGRTIAELRAATAEGADGTEVWIDLPREVLTAATDHMRRSIPPLYAKWRDASAEVGMLGVYGPRARALLQEVLDGPAPTLEEDERAEGSFEGTPVRVVGSRYAGGEDGFEITLPAEALPPLRDALLSRGESTGVREVGFAALETLRIEAGRPRGGHELTEETIPTEAFESTGMMERAISFGKGCYTGQEVIVRIAHRGHVNRHLRGLVLSGGGLPAEGTRIFHPESGKDVGWTASATKSPLLGRPIALAFVRREVEPGESVHLGEPGGPEARVTILPFHAED
jgi:aminomethyltransferase